MVKVNWAFNLTDTDKLAKLEGKKEQQESSSKPVNYTLFNQKITFEFLKAHLWSAADILRDLSADLFIYYGNKKGKTNSSQYHLQCLVLRWSLSKEINRHNINGV